MQPKTQHEAAIEAAKAAYESWEVRLRSKLPVGVPPIEWESKTDRERDHAVEDFLAGLAAYDAARSGEAEGPSHGTRALTALLDALKRRRMLFWTGNVLVECEGAIDVSRHKDDLSGAVTMVLDDEDFAALCALAEHPEPRQGEGDAANDGGEGS